MPPSLRAITAYTADPWDSALPVLRFLEPCRAAGIEVIRGNEGNRIFPERVSGGDLVMLQRDFPRFRQGYAEVIARARDEEKPVVYETDDLQLELPEEHIARPELRDYLIPIFRAIATADAVTCSTADLCERLRALNPNVLLLPNYLPDRLWSFKEPPAPAADGPVVIGYMGGGTHRADLAMLAPILLRLGLTYGERLRFRFWGGRPPEDLLRSPQVEWIEMDEQNYAGFARYFAAQSCDLFIAPLLDTPFNRCKSAIKFFEYGTLGIPGVWSRVTPYSAVVRHGENGYLAGSDDEWQQYLQRLIEDPDLRARMGRAAQETVRQGWLLSQHAAEWPDTYHQILASGRQAASLSPAVQIALSVNEQVESRQSELEQDLKILHKSVQEMAAEIKTLQERSNQLDEILNSRSWKLVQQMQKIRQAPFKRRDD